MESAVDIQTVNWVDSEQPGQLSHCSCWGRGWGKPL